MSQMSAVDRELIDAAADGDLAAVERLLAAGANPLASCSGALRFAAGGKGGAECVRRLIPISDPMEVGSEALRRAADAGCAERVRLLLPVSDPLAHGSYALRSAALRGHAECVRLLLPASNPLTENSVALVFALAGRSAQCVALLLPVSDVEAAGGEAWLMESARDSGREEVIAVARAFMEARELSQALGERRGGSGSKASL